MTPVFIGGSRKITRLNDVVRQRLDEITQARPMILIGDANGADKAVQSFLNVRHYDLVTVYCTGACRNNLGGWPVREVAPPHRQRDFEYFTAKDAAMSKDADYGLMLWDGESAGTFVNAARLVSAGKLAVVYVAKNRSFATLRTRDDIECLLRSASDEARERVSAYIADHVPEFIQPAMF